MVWRSFPVKICGVLFCRFWSGFRPAFSRITHQFIFISNSLVFFRHSAIGWWIVNEFWENILMATYDDTIWIFSVCKFLWHKFTYGLFLGNRLFPYRIPIFFFFCLFFYSIFISTWWKCMLNVCGSNIISDSILFIALHDYTHSVMTQCGNSHKMAKVGKSLDGIDRKVNKRPYITPR